MINSRNYYETISKIKIHALPETLQEMAKYVDDVTTSGQSWAIYKETEEIKETIDLYFQQLDNYTGVKSDPKAKAGQSKAPTAKPQAKSIRKPSAGKGSAAQNHKSPLKVVKRNTQKVERISEEIKMIKRYTLMHNKVKTPDQIRLFINAMQRAIAEKRIRKTSPFAVEIMEVQDSLLRLFSLFKGQKELQVSINDERRNHFLNLIGKQELMLSTRFIKSYIGLQGKWITNTQAKNLHNRIGKAIMNGNITDKDAYWNEIESLLSHMKSFVKKNSDGGMLVIPARELNGLNGIVSGLGGGLNGMPTISDSAIIKGYELAEMDFPSIGFQGKWLDFIGDPSPGFTAMVFARPKYGKSVLCIGLAHYLQTNHGEVLYVAKEEKAGRTLQDKMLQNSAFEVSFTGVIPEDLSPYEYVFLDSVTKLGLTTGDLDRFREQYPTVGFIFIFQSTKQGAFRGSNGYQHDVDIVIELPEIGHAIQYGRYNQGAEMEVFIPNTENYD